MGLFLVLLPLNACRSSSRSRILCAGVVATQQQLRQQLLQPPLPWTHHLSSGMAAQGLLLLMPLPVMAPH